MNDDQCGDCLSLMAKMDGESIDMVFTSPPYADQIGETSEDALACEIREEMKTDIIVGDYLDTIEYDYPEFHLSMKC